MNTFSAEQRRVLNLVVTHGKSVFLTGSAGTGKSFLLRRIIKELKCKYKKDNIAVAVTASTGLAAYNIGGTTLHSFAGVGLGKEPKERLVEQIERKWQSEFAKIRPNFLIERGMSDYFRAQLLNKYLLKRTDLAKTRWSRVKVLVIDEVSMIHAEYFDKLEYIARYLRRSSEPFGGIQLVATGDFLQLPPVADQSECSDEPLKFCFDSQMWPKCVPTTVPLTQVYRQRDPEFVQILNEIRLGRVSPETCEKLTALERLPVPAPDGVLPTELFPLRRDVDDANNQRLSELPGRQHTFEAIDNGEVPPPYRDKMLDDMCIAAKTLPLKVGAQVMLIRNDFHEKLVNGSLGKVVGFEGGYPVVRFLCGIEAPCPPMTWEIKTPSSQNAKRSSEDDPDNESDIKITASRKQIPLILAWALSIHKSQGQTIERVKVDLGNIFELGQAYVALSRAKSADGLQVVNFSPNVVAAHPRATAFYEKLEAADVIARQAEEREGLTMHEFKSYVQEKDINGEELNSDRLVRLSQKRSTPRRKGKLRSRVQV